MTATGAKVLAAMVLSLGLMLGVPPSGARAGDPEPTNAQIDKHKKPVAHGRDACVDASSRPRVHTYAKTGNCEGCKPIALPYDPGKPCDPRPMKQIRKAKKPAAAKTSKPAHPADEN